MSITIPKLHIVIPVYNEDKNVIDIVKQKVYEKFNKKIELEIIIIGE